MTALINDTTGTLIASHYVNPKTKIACIFGTGCNAAYMEHVKDIPKIKNLGIDERAEMAINCEWVGDLPISLLLLTDGFINRVPLIRSSMSTFQERNTTQLLMNRRTSQESRLSR